MWTCCAARRRCIPSTSTWRGSRSRTAESTKRASLRSAPSAATLRWGFSAGSLKFVRGRLFQVQIVSCKKDIFTIQTQHEKQQLHFTKWTSGRSQLHFQLIMTYSFSGFKDTKGELYGIRSGVPSQGSACVEYKCSGPLYSQVDTDITDLEVNIEDSGSK